MEKDARVRHQRASASLCRKGQGRIKNARLRERKLAVTASSKYFLYIDTASSDTHADSSQFFIVPHARTRQHEEPLSKYFSKFRLPPFLFFRQVEFYISA